MIVLLCDPEELIVLVTNSRLDVLLNHFLLECRIHDAISGPSLPLPYWTVCVMELDMSSRKFHF